MEELIYKISRYFAVEFIEDVGNGVYFLKGRFVYNDEKDAEKVTDIALDYGYYAYIDKMEQAYVIRLIPQSHFVGPGSKSKVISLILFILTLFSTLFVGSMWYGANPLKNPLDILKGYPFAFSIMFIIGLHEMAHFIASKKHRVKATYPFFIPFPNIIGTLGAVISIRSPIPSRKALVDIGIAGPIGSFIASIPFAIIGILKSKLVSISDIPSGGLVFGDSIIFKILTFIIKGDIPEGYDLLIHPLGFAGWVGFFITGINLLPGGQLDGGHIAYGLFKEKHRLITIILAISLFLLGFIWRGWWIWALLIFFTGLRHQPPLNSITPLDKKRKILCFIALIILVLTFIPVPIKLA